MAVRGISGQSSGFRGYKAIIVLSVFALIFMLGACAAPSAQRAKAVAIVDGYPLTQEDLFYSITVAHRMEGLGATGEINLKEYLQKLIDERLIIEEARRIGMEKNPFVSLAVDDFILRESVVMLHQEEILGKIIVSDEEIKEKYKNDYERFSISIIEAESEDDAKKAFDFLKEGGDFKEAVQLYSLKKDRSDYEFNRRNMRREIADEVLRLKAGEFSDVIEVDNKRLIIRLIERKGASDEDFDKFKEDIKREILKQKERVRTAEYLEYLRKNKNIKIYEDVLSEIKNVDLKGDKEEIKEEIKRLSEDKRAVVEMDGHSLLAGRLLAMLVEQKAKAAGMEKTFDIEKAIEGIINSWIDFKLVDIEALSREYHIKTDLKDRVDSYRNRLLRDVYVREVIAPQVKVSEGDLKGYYQNNLNKYMKPVKIRIQQITVNDMDTASEIEESLKMGVDFSWLAKRRSTDALKEKGGDAGFVDINSLPQAARDAVSGLMPGQISPIFKVHEGYRIIKVLDRSKEEPKEFESVKDDVSREYFGERLKEIYEVHVADLKKGAHIEIFEDALIEIEKRLKGKE